MKKNILYFLFLFSFLWFQSVSAATLAPSITVTGTTAANTTWAGNGWKLIFPSTNWVHIDTTWFTLATVRSNPWTGNMWITGSFWLQNLSDSTDASLWWATFDIGAPKVVLTNNWDNTFTFNWYARSHAAGWIYFWDTWVTNGKVIYDRSTWIINGCAFWENIGWMCIDNFSLDTIPPDFVYTPLRPESTPTWAPTPVPTGTPAGTPADWYSFKLPFSADHNKSLTTPEPIQKIEIENWNSTAQTTHTTQTFIHDFRQVKTYNFTVTDTTGNISDPQNFTVVANVPTSSLDTYNIWVSAASTYSWSYTTNKKWDGFEKHTIEFTLRDTYGNVVKNESWIKDVKVWITFDNTVDTNQMSNSNNDLWDAIRYSSNPFSLVNWYWNSGTWYQSSWDYNIDIASFAPTSSWYAYTTANNNIKLSGLHIVITWLVWHTWVWEQTNNTLFWSDYTDKNFKFTPAVKLDTFWNDRNFKLLRDVETTFTGWIKIDKSSSSSGITDLKIHYILDIMTGSVYKNNNLSFQKIDGINATTDCVWYLKPTDSTYTNSSYYSNNTTDCNSNWNSSSQIIKSYTWPYTTSTILNDKFKATPKVVISWMSTFDSDYHSEISYTQWWNDIKYPSLNEKHTNSLVNREVKIAGIAHGTNKNTSVIAESSIKSIGNIDKITFYTQIKRHVADYRKNGSIWTVQYFSTQQTLNSWPAGIDTIIVDGADIIIANNIWKTAGTLKTIIALKKDNVWWNIWIKKNVQFIWAVLVTDRSIISGDGINYYSDTTTAPNQLFIKGSLLSYNTVGWASSGSPKCPFYITETCTEQIAKRYDLNHLRSFVNGLPWNDSINGSTYWVNMSKSWYADAPVIVEYDSEIQTKPPKILTNY